MDDIVKQAMAKWPNVPHCYGWLALDARGAWRMRDERVQSLGLPGDKIVHPALLQFINRNYQHDERGCWYFQNGPQRVFVNLEATPHIAHTDPTHGFVLHTGEVLQAIDSVWLADNGNLLLQQRDIIALVDDRDMAQCLDALRVDGNIIDDENLLAWMNRQPGQSVQPDMPLTFMHAGCKLAVHHIAWDRVASRFGFIQSPQPDSK
jgi:Protein of unknown function (DUF2946)